MVLIHNHAKKAPEKHWPCTSDASQMPLHIDLRFFLRAFIPPDPKVK